ncbi:MAG: RNA polymerase sigma factor [Sedimentisphaerales bacterium]|nr:RNA polymerase sigma factor [Sedimentisphaerales bacterium]
MNQQDQLDTQIRLCQQGRPEGFRWLLAQYGPRLRAYFFRVSGSSADADDLLQDLFVKLIENIKDYQHKGRFESWLFRIAANLARDRVRRLSHNGPQVTDQKILEYENVDPNQELPDELAQKAEQHDRLRKAVAQLPLPDREIVLLRHYGQLSFKELAAHFKMPLGTVLAKVHRSLKRLRVLLEQE